MHVKRLITAETDHAYQAVKCIPWIGDLLKVRPRRQSVALTRFIDVDGIKLTKMWSRRPNCDLERLNRICFIFGFYVPALIHS